MLHSPQCALRLWIETIVPDGRCGGATGSGEVAMIVGSDARQQWRCRSLRADIVKLQQDFNKNIINVLQTGSCNLTLADANEEAANSQALSTRQSIATSALSLANQSQQSVLQLLR